MCLTLSGERLCCLVGAGFQAYCKLRSHYTLHHYWQGLSQLTFNPFASTLTIGSELEQNYSSIVCKKLATCVFGPLPPLKEQPTAVPYGTNFGTEIAVGRYGIYRIRTRDTMALWCINSNIERP